MASQERQRLRLGGLWSRRTATGVEVITGGIPATALEDAIAAARTWGVGRLQVVVFQNTYKSRRLDPDYVVYLEPQRPQHAPGPSADGGAL